jgi:hypothetical protein
MKALYIVSLRTLTVSLVLAVTITVVHQNFVAWMPHYGG